MERKVSKFSVFAQKYIKHLQGPKGNGQNRRKSNRACIPQKVARIVPEKFKNVPEKFRTGEVARKSGEIARNTGGVVRNLRCVSHVLM